MSDKEISEATLISNEQYCKLLSPKFMGQTRLHANKQYKMYWQQDDILYYTVNDL